MKNEIKKEVNSRMEIENLIAWLENVKEWINDAVEELSEIIEQIERKIKKNKKIKSTVD